MKGRKTRWTLPDRGSLLEMVSVGPFVNTKDNNWGNLEALLGIPEGQNWHPGATPTSELIMVLGEINKLVTPLYHHWLMRFDNLCKTTYGYYFSSSHGIFRTYKQ